MQKFETFLNEKKKTRIFSAKIQEFFWTKKTIGVFSVRIRGFFFKENIMLVLYKPRYFCLEG